MSGRDEQPSVGLTCPKCKDIESRDTKRWSILVGQGCAYNFGGYYVESGKLNRKFLSRFIGKKVSRIKCDCPTLSYQKRHEYYAGDKMFELLMKKIKFVDGIVSER